MPKEQKQIAVWEKLGKQKVTVQASYIVDFKD